MLQRYISGFFRMLMVILCCSAQVSGQNDALYFDGDNDYITLSPIGFLGANSNFTMEAWFTADAGPVTCNGANFRRLFALGGVNSRFEVGNCQGNLLFYWNSPTSSGGPVTITPSGVNIQDGAWHCISVIRNGNNVQMVLDGNSVYTGMMVNAGAFNFNLFRVGHWGGGLTPDQDWLGKVDDVKLWAAALPVASLTACKECVPKGTESGLIAYWPLDDGVANAVNTLTQVADGTPAGNDGVLTGFTLNNTTTGLSNFTASTSPLIYPVYKNLSMFMLSPVNPPTTFLSNICSGDPVHFSIVDFQGNPVSAAGASMVEWEYSDDAFATPGTTIIPTGGSAVFSGFSFVTPPNHPALLCNNSPNQYVDRSYRAIIKVTNGTTNCFYFVQSVPLRICCPVQNAQINVTPMGPLCEGDMAQFTASVSSNMPAPSGANNVHIDWFLNNVPLGAAYHDQPTITYGPITLTSGQLCFKAIISNCACPAVTVQKCITVDQRPSCGTITGSTTPNTLMPDPDGNPDHYLICPGNDAAIEMVTPFNNCTPVWQYNFPNAQPGFWHNMGSSNSQQNTNILPHINPNVSPFAWPLGETCIRYRIECQPLNTPSGCPPCYSNEVQVCLKTPPPAPVITAVQPQICKGDVSFLSVQNPDPNCNYEWYGNGLLVGFGDFFNATQGGCYVVTCNDGCFTVTSNKVCVEVCESVAIISCQIPVCPCVGDPITIDGLNSYSTCGYALIYTWTWIDSNGVFQTYVGSSLTDVPAAAGTTYTLTVTDTVLGCSDTAQYFIKPCSN